ncbi:2-C-methyl-D-erythritol 2,4-cyclodiphosphate synthase [Desulfobacterales bacterium HSG17]|nr:2-C-methyl-D-erythritol 2,4-cyclodiphosphate synthase [Desulfobacterales bacterium HSG17]
MRIGQGYDVHQLVKGRPLIIGGVKIPYDYGLLGHSDADVLTHAVCDALLGATGLGDIGLHFPDHDPAYHGIDSMKLLLIVNDKISKEGYGIINMDCTLMAEAPKVAPYTSKMRANFSRVLNISETLINIKATTTEGLGYIGNGEGMAAGCIVLVDKVASK